MFTKLLLEIHGSRFDLEGSFEIDAQVLDLLARWFAAVPNAAGDQAQVDALAADLKQQQDTLSAAVTTATPATP